MIDRKRFSPEEILERIIWGLEAGFWVVLYLDDGAVPNAFSLALCSEEQLSRLKEVLLKSRSQIVSFPTGEKLPELFGNGVSIKSFGMNPPKLFVPTKEFEREGRWAQRVSEGIQYLVRYEMAHHN